MSMRRSSADPTWIFDLDNTLHDANPHIFPHINRSMTAYLETHLGLACEEANRLRTHYWRRYGATLLGLMRHHGIDPTHFLWETHQFPELHRMVLRNPLLRSVLRRLPGRKLVFSNSPVHYSAAVLRLLHKHRLQPRRCVMVEDNLDNLKTAKRLGMRTVWVSVAAKAPAYVDLSIRHVAQLPAALRALRVS